MSGRPCRYRLLWVAPAMAILASCAPQVPPEPEVESKLLAEPPRAVAPPDAGVKPPEVRLLALDAPPVPTPQRPQQQLKAWSESMSDALNIPRAALQAYGYASRLIEQRLPGCGLSWPVLAGIGAVESSHGRHGGATLDETGRPSVTIRGLPLDGKDGVKLIEDTDGGVLDGDVQFDRAIGPLQFIPSTWERWGEDADGDGVADPHDIDDAALAAGNYLCDVAGDLRDPERYWSALLTYNESRDYGQDVLDHADQYGRTSRTLAVEW